MLAMAETNHRRKNKEAANRTRKRAGVDRRFVLPGIHLRPIYESPGSNQGRECPILGGFFSEAIHLTNAPTSGILLNMAVISGQRLEFLTKSVAGADSEEAVNRICVVFDRAGWGGRAWRKQGQESGVRGAAAPNPRMFVCLRLFSTSSLAIYECRNGGNFSLMRAAERRNTGSAQSYEI